jgi:hypothetical protein
MNLRKNEARGKLWKELERNLYVLPCSQYFIQFLKSSFEYC